MTNDRFAELFGEPVRGPDQLLTRFHMDVAASIQSVLDEAVLRLTRNLAKQTGSRNLCLAGGVALNCVANGKVFARCQLREHLDSARRRATLAVRSAPRLRPTTFFKDQPRETHGADAMSGSFLGPGFLSGGDRTEDDCRGGQGSPLLGEDEMIETTAQALAGEKSRGLVSGPYGIRPAARSAHVRSWGDPRFARYAEKTLT